MTCIEHASFIKCSYGGAVGKELDLLGFIVVGSSVPCGIFVLRSQALY